LLVVNIRDLEIVRENLNMKIVAIVLSTVFWLTACQTPKVKSDSNWVCNANGLAGFSYSGGATANIHLQGYSRGGDYPVIFNQNKTQVTGTTKNGTDFFCEKRG
jgi:hypothetical protein